MMNQLASLGLREPTGIQTQAKTMKLCFAHRSLQPQEQPVVVIARVVDPIGVPDERVEDCTSEVERQ